MIDIAKLTEKDIGRKVICHSEDCETKRYGCIVNWDNENIVINFRKCSPLLVVVNPKDLEFYEKN